MPPSVVLTAAERMALIDILGEFLRTPNHTEVYIDSATGTSVTPEDLLARLLTGQTTAEWARAAAERVTPDE